MNRHSVCNAGRNIPMIGGRIHAYRYVEMEDDLL